MKRLAFIGGGGFAKEALELAELNGYEVVGYAGESPSELDRPYWGAKESLLARRTEFDAVCVAFGAVDRESVQVRRDVLNWVTTNGLRAATLLSPHAVLSKGATVAEGSIVAHGVVVSVDARVGAFSILNTGAIIGHDAELGENTIMAPAAFIGGMSKVGANTLIGPGVNVLQGLTVGAQVVVGVGGSVVRDVPDGATVWPLRSKVMIA